MAHRVVFRPQAEDEALEVQRWYESRRAGLGAEFGQAIDALVARILERPLAFQRAHKETRRAVLTRFPYALYYRIGGWRNNEPPRLKLAVMWPRNEQIGS